MSLFLSGLGTGGSLCCLFFIRPKVERMLIACSLTITPHRDRDRFGDNNSKYFAMVENVMYEFRNCNIIVYCKLYMLSTI